MLTPSLKTKNNLLRVESSDDWPSIRWPYDAFEHLRRALFWKPDTLMFAHTAYFDDSGKKEQKILVVGGYVATVHGWGKFCADWRLALAKKHIAEFKRADFNMHKIGDWPQPERGRFLRDLAQIIHSYTKHAFCYAVNMPDWCRANETYQMAEKNYYPYPLCARTCIKGVREWCDENGYDKGEVEYVFDGGSEHAGHLIELLKRDVDPLLRELTPAPANSKKVRPIQAADYFAWEVRRQIVKDPNPHPRDAYATLLGLLRIPAKASTGIYDLDALRKLCKAAHIPRR